jgi:hypothetical protein
MKQLIRLIRLCALTAVSVALHSAHREMQAAQTSHDHHYQKSGLLAEPEGELVLRGIDGTVIAREVDLAPHGTRA